MIFCFLRSQVSQKDATRKLDETAANKRRNGIKDFQLHFCYVIAYIWKIGNEIKQLPRVSFLVFPHCVSPTLFFFMLTSILVEQSPKYFLNSLQLSTLLYSFAHMKP